MNFKLRTVLYHAEMSRTTHNYHVIYKCNCSMTEQLSMQSPIQFSNIMLSMVLKGQRERGVCASIPQDMGLL